MSYSNPLSRILLIIAGTLSIVLGVIGIFVPLLPTVPFLLLAAYCYSKSSEKFYNWLITNRWFGKMIRDYKEGKGVPMQAKVYSIIFLWLAIGCSTIFVVESNTMKIVLILVGVAVTVHLMMLKSYREER